MGLLTTGVAAAPGDTLCFLGTDLADGDPPRQARRGGRAQSRHRREHLPGDILTLTIQTHQEVRTSQLRASQTHQQPTGPPPASTRLDRSHCRVQHLNHPEPITQLGYRSHPRHPRQRRIRRADPHPLTSPPPTAYPATSNRTSRWFRKRSSGTPSISSTNS
ncbi:MAG: hypothetical protein ACRDRS_11540 [Pseudonocardiaceae bacterium]